MVQHTVVGGPVPAPGHWRSITTTIAHPLFEASDRPSPECDRQPRKQHSEGPSVRQLTAGGCVRGCLAPFLDVASILPKCQTDGCPAGRPTIRCRTSNSSWRRQRCAPCRRPSHGMIGSGRGLDSCLPGRSSFHALKRSRRQSAGPSNEHSPAAPEYCANVCCRAARSISADRRRVRELAADLCAGLFECI